MLPKLNIEKARPNEKYVVRDETMISPRQRLPTQRAASVASGLVRQMSTRETVLPRQQSQRRRSEDQEDDDYSYNGDLYDMYSATSSRSSRGNRNTATSRRQQPRYIEEEDEYASDYDDGFFDENDFEIVSRSALPRSRASQSATSSQSQRPNIRKIRVKVHAEDVRYMMIGVAIDFSDLNNTIKEKFGLRKRFKIKIRDDEVPNGDMITLGDQDDLDMAIMGVKSQAKKDRLEMGKMEVSIFLAFPH